MTKRNGAWALFSLVLVLFLDGLGQGIIYPVLANALGSSHVHVLVAHASTYERNILYGTSMAVFFFCWFFGAVLLGDMSDGIGRKKALVIVLVGMALGNLLSALAFIVHSITLVFLGRIVVGFTAGSQAIAQAAIVDIGDPSQQARNTGLILAGVIIGLVVGPVLGGVLSNPQFVSWFSDATPLYFTALLAVLNILLLLFLFQETFEVKHKPNIRLTRAITAYLEGLKHKEIRPLVGTFAMVQFGWTTFYLGMPLYVIQIAHQTRNGVSLYMAVLGIGLSLGAMVFCNWCEKLFASNKWVTFWGYNLMLFGVLLTLLVANWYVKLAGGFVAALACAVAYVFMIKVMSAHASKDKQGWVMGLQNSTMVLATGCSSLVIGLTSAGGIMTPYVIGVVVTMLGCVALAFSK